MKTVELDVRQYPTKASLFAAMRELFACEKDNFDALHDVLTAIGKQTRITVSGTSSAKSGYIDVFLRVLADSADENEKLTVLLR